MGKPKISIIVAVYNTSQYLEKCLTKVTSQNMRMEDYEIIIVNDCSTDKSMEIVSQYAGNYKNIKVIDKKVNEATFWSRVDGMELAAGEYVGFVDSDDWIEENMFSCLYETANAKLADIVECQFIVEGNDEFEKDSPFEEGIQVINEVIDAFTHRKVSAALWMRIYSKRLKESVLEHVRSFGNRDEFCGIRNEDELLFPLFLNRANSYYVLKQRLYHYRVDSGGSIMKEIAEDYNRKLFHADTVILAGSMLLEDSIGEAFIHKMYSDMQRENMFYLIGIILRGKCWNEIPRYKIVIRQYWALNRRLNIRNIHLCLKCIYVNILWKMQQNRR